MINMKMIVESLEKHPNIKRILFIICMILFFAFEYFIMQFSTNHSITKFVAQPLTSIFVNTFILFTINMVIYLFTKNWFKTLIIGSVLVFVWSIADYYTVQYHGGPLFVSELVNFKAALNVMGGTKPTITLPTVCIIIGFMTLLFGIILLKKIFTKDYFQILFIKKLLLTLCCIVVVFVLHFTSISFKPRSAMTWNWNETVSKYGIGSILIEDVDKMINYLKTPDGYSSEELNNIAVYKSSNNNQIKPDIIMILNESLYDLNEYDDFEADVDPLEELYNIPGAKYGHAVVPSSTGGTNDSEYELLSSHSMYLLYNHAPFNYLNLRDTWNNVRTLEEIGYETVGMHSFYGDNYSRYGSYPEIGFDKSLLYPEYFTVSENGHRIMTDSSNYKDMIDYYNSMSDSPRFVYLLTYQNHCTWEVNDDSLDTVHVNRDYGQYTDDINEYLSSIQLSSTAFKELVEYYNNQDRPVIICMVGDHSPNILNFVGNYQGSEKESDYVKKSTPLVVWSNIELRDVDLEHIPMVSVIPTLQYMADLPMNTYQKEIFDITQNEGVLTSDGYLVNKDLKFASIKEEDVYNRVKNYYFMEYNDLKFKSKHREDLFTLAK